MKRSLFLAIVLAVGCSRNDVATLGRIGQRATQQVESVWTTEPNKSLLKTLPLLQPAKSGAAPEVPPAEEQKPPADPRL
ncbi:MAG: hypothetical protein K1X57_17025 [Gemmataceae bacterium]|nr:hypothetical protein [Gemmataceae bacterium]